MGATDYSEMAGYPIESHESSGHFTATRKLICDWADRYAVLLGFLPATGLGAIYDYVGIAIARAVNGSIDPFDAELSNAGADPLDKQSAYDSAIVTVVFKTPGAGTHVPQLDPTDPSGLRVISEDIEPLNEFLRLDNTLFRWSGGDPVSEGEAPTRQLHGFVWVYIRHKVALPIHDDIFDFPNHTNQFQVDSPTLGKTFGVETLLMMRPRIVRLDGSLIVGGQFARVELRFGYRESGWNKVWRVKPGSAGYEEFLLLDGSTIYKNFPPKPFSNLVL